jgi:tRNA modification GTPase
VEALLLSVAGDLETEVEGSHAAERIRDGFEVAIVGAPNAGKSTLLNALAGREAAITSAVAGTTRDVIEVRMDLAGLPVTVLDTAGLRETTDEVEGIGVARALARAGAADLRVFLRGGEVADLPLAPRPGDIVVQGKADLGVPPGDLAVSGRTGEGLGALTSAIIAALEPRAARAATATRERHRAAMVDALGAIASAQAVLSRQGPSELAAEDLRRAVRFLESLIGRVDVEHLLDEIFASFCIGK